MPVKKEFFFIGIALIIASQIFHWDNVFLFAGIFLVFAALFNSENGNLNNSKSDQEQF